MAAPQPQVWFITGCSSGFGLNLSLIALKAGHHVIGTSRSPSPALIAQFEELGGKVLKLDLVGKDMPQVVESAIKIYGHIDVLINNAGYSILGAVEDISDEEARIQMDTNFFAPLSIIRTILPSMRARKSGSIVNISSAQGINGLPSTGLYSASKFALEGLSESLSQEVAPLGIRVLIVEPGGFRSEFNNNLKQPQKPISEAYKGSMVDTILSSVKSWHHKQTGDLQKGCQLIYDVVTGTGQGEGLEEKVGEKFLRLPMGSDCVQQVAGKVAGLEKTLKGLEKISVSTDYVETST